MAGKLKHDLTGQKFGRITVIKRIDRPIGDRSDTRWLCECECGSVKEIVSASLLGGKTKSCGCLSREIHSALKIAENTANGVYDDISGKRFGRLTAIEYTYKKNGIKKRLHIRCKCDCGKEVEIQSNSVLNGATNSCGCINNEKATERINAYKKKATIDGTCIIKISNMQPYKSNISGVRGVSVRGSAYVARITFKKKTYHLGKFDTIEEAASIRKEAEDKIFGEFLEWYYEKHPEMKKDAK